MTVPNAKYYILDGKEAVPVDDVMEWAQYFETANRRVAEDHIYCKWGKGGFLRRLFSRSRHIRISTVFLGLDHSLGGEYPELFETWVTDDDDLSLMFRYSDWGAAQRGHYTIRACILAGGDPENLVIPPRTEDKS